MVEFNGVNPDQVDVVYQSLSAMIEKGISSGQGDGTTWSHMRAAIIRGDMLMWAACDDNDIIACMVLSVRKTDTMTKLFIELLAGRNMSMWVDGFENLLLEFKELTGARCIESSCRLGLSKYLQKRGWRKKSVIMELL